MRTEQARARKARKFVKFLGFVDNITNTATSVQTDPTHSIALPSGGFWRFNCLLRLHRLLKQNLDQKARSDKIPQELGNL